MDKKSNLIFLLVIILSISCHNNNENNLRYKDSYAIKESDDSISSSTKKDTIPPSLKKDTISSSLKKDTLFYDYYYGMKHSDFNSKKKKYYFILGGKSVTFNVKGKFSYSTLTNLLLEKDSKNSLKKEFENLLTLYKEKYGIPIKFSSKKKKIIYHKNHKIKHIYWSYNLPRSFDYNKKNVHTNKRYTPDGTDRPAGCLLEVENEFSLNHKYHIHATNRQTGEEFVFDVDLKEMDNTYVVYLEKKYEFKKGKKVVKLESSILQNPESYIRYTKNSSLFRYLFKMDSISKNSSISEYNKSKKVMDMDRLREIPYDSIQVKYTLNNFNSKKISPKKNINSKIIIQKNKNDI